ncbi:MAG: hypothetical protein MZV64_33790 [Ignavibacteriales bacterium]|nr:hypothetical protein [Ignavibacteriales bacterium]
MLGPPGTSRRGRGRLRPGLLGQRLRRSPDRPHSRARSPPVPTRRAPILKALTGKDTPLYAPALAAVPAAFGPADIGQVTDLMAGLPEDGQIQLTAVLAGYPAEAVQALRSSPPRKARPST